MTETSLILLLVVVGAKKVLVPETSLIPLSAVVGIFVMAAVVALPQAHNIL